MMGKSKITKNPFVLVFFFLLLNSLSCTFSALQSNCISEIGSLSVIALFSDITRKLCSIKQKTVPIIGQTNWSFAYLNKTSFKTFSSSANVVFLFCVVFFLPSGDGPLISWKIRDHKFGLGQHWWGPKYVMTSFSLRARLWNSQVVSKISLLTFSFPRLCFCSINMPRM